MDLVELKKDRQNLQVMLEVEQQKLIDTQNACLRFEGALTYNSQCIAFLEQEDEPDKPVS